MKKRIISLFLVLALFVSVFTATSFAAGLPTSGDMVYWTGSSEWSKPYLDRALELGIYPECLYSTDLRQPITRAEFTSLILAIMCHDDEMKKVVNAAAEKVAQTDYDNPFTDVDNTDVLTAAELDIVNGMGNGIFQPAGTLTREQAVTMIGRMEELGVYGEVQNGTRLPTGPIDLGYFDDDAQISDWSRCYVYCYATRGVLNGMGDGTFAPKSLMTREQAIKIAACMFYAD